MKGHEDRVSQSFRGVGGWIDAHPTLVPPEAAGQVEVLRGVNQRLAQYVIDQEQHDRARSGGTVTVQQLRRDLRQNHLIPIAAMARSVVTITPELEVALRVPRPNADDAKVLASANAIAAIGDAHRDVLVQHGLPATFVDELRAEAATLQTAVDERRQAKSRRVGATKGIAVELKTGRLVVQALDIVIKRALRAQPGLLAEWRNIKRVTIKPVHPAAAPETAAASPAPAATPTEQKAA
jgi:hypothetical protein